MGVHKIRYVVRPPGACPKELLSGKGPGGACEVDTDFVAACAMGELFQTGGGSSRPLALLFEELLVSGGKELIWKGKGPGRGKEMRRAFSGLFGRFFARAYLSRYHDFAWFMPIDGDPTNVSKRLRVSRLSGQGTELPDWICGSGSGRVAVAEAKGTSQASNGTGAGLPGPIRTADGQLKGVVVESLRKVAGEERWTAVRTKGWAVMSRWGVEIPPRDAFIYVLDPDTPGDPPSAHERDDMVQDIARAHVAYLLAGMGFSEMASQLLAEHVAGGNRAPEGAFLGSDGEASATFLGVPVGPLGVLPFPLDRARTLAQTMPDSIRFVGVDADVIRRALAGQRLDARARRSEGPVQIGADGLLYAPIDRVTQRSWTI
ncbi:hypothetical protein [Bradyrhizobium tropiciagri]|uniref:hypothetical protein n=1 Tax=Bradyrhizobium tropiciagri TaxID=312253 RepID=UPI00067E1770|nr:hypothetical protein [Bradyrhizobium tropiciagri]